MAEQQKRESQLTQPTQPQKRLGPKKKTGKGSGESSNLFSLPVVALLFMVILLMGFSQYQMSGIKASLSLGTGRVTAGGGAKDLAAIDIDALTSTGHTLAAVLPVEDIVTSEDAMAILFPTGTPEYGASLGVSFDDPVGALSVLARMYRPLTSEVKANNPEAWQRFLTLALKPVGISCEYCCGVGPIGIDRNGNSACGCQHNPALLSVALWLTANTDYNDGEILREVMRWKTLFFPQKMIELGMTVAGGDTSALDNLPGMVGGC